MSFTPVNLGFSLGNSMSSQLHPPHFILPYPFKSHHQATRPETNQLGYGDAQHE